MDVWVNREPTGCEIFELEDIQELEEQLGSFGALKPLDDKSEIKVEITGTWGEIRELLTQSFFKDIWFNPRRIRPDVVGYGCAFCGILGDAAPDGSLPEGWEQRHFEDGAHYLCPDCKEDRMCRVCGCSDVTPCEGGCYWVEEDLCSACAEKSK